MGTFVKRRYFIQKPGCPKVTFAPILGLADALTKHEFLQEVGFRQWFEEMWQQSDYTDAPFDIPTERDYWEKWV